MTDERAPNGDAPETVTSPDETSGSTGADAPTSSAPSGWVVPGASAPRPATAQPTGAGWVQPAPAASRSMARFVIGGIIVIAILTIVVIGGLIFLGSQVANQLKGTVESGTGGSGCVVTGAASTFPVGTDIHLVAYLRRQVQPGETITATVSKDGTVLLSVPESTAVVADCVMEDIPGQALESGTYHIEYRVADELLASGEFSVGT